MSVGDGAVDRVRGLVGDALSLGDRATVSKYLPLIAVAFLVVAAGGGYLAYSAATAPGTETQTETAGTWNVEGGFEHGATIQRDTTVFPAGSRLENRQLYFSQLAPVLDGEYVLTHRGDTEAASGTVELELVLEATEDVGEAAPGPAGEDGTIVHWRETETLGTETIESIAPGEERAVTFETNTTALVERIDSIEEELGASPGTTGIAVVAVADLEAEVAGERFVDTREDRLEISPGGGTYSVESSPAGGETYEATRTAEVPVEPSPIALYGGPVLLVVGLLGAGLAVAARRVKLFALEEHERALLAYRRTRSDYDKWISMGSVPAEDDRTVAELDSLEDLVNVAIDSDRRVIERAGESPRFVVLDGGVRYVFDPDPAAVSPDGVSAAEPIDPDGSGPDSDDVPTADASEDPAARDGAPRTD